MKRILAPHGVKPIDLEKHLINIGFNQQKKNTNDKNTNDKNTNDKNTNEINIDFLFFDYNKIKKESKILDESLSENYKCEKYKCYNYKCNHYNCKYHNCNYYNYDHYNCDDYNYNNILKEDLQNKINYSSDCLIEPFDDGFIDYDAISEGYIEDDNSFDYNIDENDENGDYYDDYAYRKKY